jgi:hypothetical protein
MGLSASFVDAMRRRTRLEHVPDDRRYECAVVLDNVLVPLFANESNILPLRLGNCFTGSIPCGHQSLITHAYLAILRVVNLSLLDLPMPSNGIAGFGHGLLYLSMLSQHRVLLDKQSCLTSLVYRGGATAVQPFAVLLIRSPLSQIINVH